VADRPEGVSEGLFALKAKSPEGQKFKIEGTASFEITGPAFLAAPGAGRAVNGVLNMINRPWLAVQARQKRKRTPDCEVAVFERSAGKWRLVHDETAESMDRGRARAEKLVAKIEAGTFRPNRAGD
jgi:hypothetical protein